MEIIEYINSKSQLKQLVNYHNVNTQGIPPAYRNKITRVPTLLTKNSKILVGNEIKNWLESLLPNKEVEHCGIGNDLFSLDNYGQALQPAITRELEEKINRDVSKGDVYSEQI
jgi:hypothetical protein